MALLLLSWLLLICIQPAQMVVISSSSSTNLIPLGSNVTFTCTDFQSEEAFLHSFIVQVGNSSPVLTINNEVVRNLAERNIFTERSSDTLTLLATLTNNLTVVQCQDGGVTPPAQSEAVHVTAIGPPLAPHVELTFASFTELQLDWEEPFTWPGHDIILYRVIETPADPEQSNTAVTNQTTYSYLSPSGNALETCQTVTFMVTASSDLGFGEPFVSNPYGLPIELEEIGEVMADVRFTKDGDPEVDVTVEVPPVCMHQVAEFTLELTDEVGETILDSFQIYNGSPSALFFSTELDRDTEYYLEVFVTSFMQNVTKKVMFDTRQSESSGSSVAYLLPVVVISSVAGAVTAILHI